MINRKARFLADRKYETQRLNEFELQIEGFGEDMMFAVRNAPIPTSTSDVLETAYGNSVEKRAGSVTFNDVTIKVRDFVGPDIEAELVRWRNQVYDPETGVVGIKEDYVRQATLYIYPPGEDATPRKHKIVNIWPSTLSLGEFSHEGGAAYREIDITLQCDEAYREL